MCEYTRLTVKGAILSKLPDFLLRQHWVSLSAHRLRLGHARLGRYKSGRTGTHAELLLPDEIIISVNMAVFIRVAVLMNGIPVVLIETQLPDEKVIAVHLAVVVEISSRGRCSYRQDTVR